jgi:multidrug efflux system membrane fusion protein
VLSRAAPCRRPRVGRAAALAAVLALAAGCSSRGDERASAAPVSRGVPVTVSPAVRKDVPVTATAIGTVQASSTVGVLSQVNGQILGVHFTEGQAVREGQLLFTLDPRPFEAALRQAEANVARDRAQLAQAEAAVGQQQAQIRQAEATLARDRAQLENAAVQERRYRELLERQLIAREQYDQIRTNAEALAATVRADEAAVANARESLRAAQAAVDNARATLRADEAALESARLQLGYTRIVAPISGRTGSLLIHEGNVVKANDVGNPMVTINRLHPIYVVFAVPEQYLADIKRFLAEETLRVEAEVPGRPERSRGELTFVNNTVDPATGTIQLKATFPNPDGALWPGQFVNVVLTLTTERGAVVVPSPAVQTGQQGPYVFVVKPDSTVELRPVRPGPTVGRETVIRGGLVPGERVVTDGQLRLAPGVRVEIKPAATS